MAGRLVREATSQRVNSDNTTVMVVALNNGVEARTEPAQLTDD